MDLIESGTRTFEVGSRHPWERARLALVARLIRRHLALRPGDVALDVGCGDSFVAEELARQHPGVMFFAVDSAFSDDLMQTFSARLTVPNVRLFKSLDDVPVDRPVSLVLLMDVIEHVPEDLAFLTDVCGRACVSGTATVLITVPAYQGLFSSHDRALGHYRRYSSRTLGALTRAAGLVPIEAGHLFASLLLLRAAQVARERVRPPVDETSQLSTWSGHDQLGRVLEALLTLDGRLALSLGRLGVKLPGLSNFAVCRKSA